MSHAIWTEAIEWVRRLPAAQAPGIYHIHGESMYANVHGYETKPREACRFESHRKYIDLQYCISGGECIEWQPLDLLKSNNKYDVQKDVLRHHSPKNPAGILRMSPGTFAVFFPADGHMPKIADGVHAAVAKAVIKIEVGLLG